MIPEYKSASFSLESIAPVLGTISPKIKTRTVRIPVAIPTAKLIFIARVVARADADRFTILLPIRMALSILLYWSRILLTVIARLLPSSARERMRTRFTVVSAVSADEKKLDRKIRIIRAANCTTVSACAVEVVCCMTLGSKNVHSFFDLLLSANIQYTNAVVKFLWACEYKFNRERECHGVRIKIRIQKEGRARMQNETSLRSRGASQEGGIPVFFLLKSLLFSYILTTGLLLLLAFFLFKFELSERPVAVAIIGIYVLATFFAGFVTGKRLQNRKFLWGLLMGVAYFVVLAVVSLAVKQSPDTLGDSFFTTLALCAGGGMLGGMIS